MVIICEEDGLKIERTICEKRIEGFYFPTFYLYKRDSYFYLMDANSHAVTIQFKDYSSVNLCGTFYSNFEDFEDALNDIVDQYNSTASGSGATNLSIGTTSSTTVEIVSDTGTNAIIPPSTTTTAGLITSSDKVKLDSQSGVNTGDEVLYFANLSAFPAFGLSGKLYIAEDTSVFYRWNGAAYLAIALVNLSEGTVTDTTVNINSSNGINGTLLGASAVRAGVMSRADKIKLDSISLPQNGVYETFKIYQAGTIGQNLGLSTFYGSRHLLPVGKYDKFAFYLSSISAILGQTGVIRGAIYDSAFSKIREVSFDVDDATAIQLSVELSFVELQVLTPELFYFVFGCNDKVGIFDIQVPSVDFVGSVSSDLVFEFTSATGLLPADISAIRSASQRVYYTKIYK